MSDANLLLEKDAAVATITFNNPKALNALTEETFTGMESLLDELENDAEIRVIILTGAGDKAFIAGGDISHLASLDAEGARQFALLAQRVIDRIETFPKPVIAAVNGYCLGGGNELAMGCDLRIAADSAKFGQPEVKLGIIPGFAGTQRLSRLVGKGRAKEMIYTGEMIDAAEACRIGLVNRVVAKDRLIKEAKALAMKMCDKSASAIRLCKEAIDNGLEMDFARAARYEADLFGLSFTTADCKEGISAFLEKRPAKF
jgi:enoyl-CoA hydratase